MKKSLVFVLLLIFFIGFVIPLVIAQDIQQNLEENVEGNIKKIENIPDKIREYSSTDKWEEKWDYLGDGWQKLLLKNKFIAKVDKFLSNFSLVFSILFAKPYSISLLLFGVIFLWMFFLFNFVDLLEASGFFKGGYKWGGGILISVILAQVGFFETLIVFFGNIAFAPKYSLTRFFILLIFVGALILIRYGDQKLAIYLKKKYGGSAEKKLERLHKSNLKRAEVREAARKRASSLGKN
jgi:hypothetical protein